VYVHSPPLAPLAANLALEVETIVDDLAARRSFVLYHWAQLRSRDATVELFAHGWRRRPVAQLLALDASQMICVEAFFRELDAAARWAAWTEEMPLAFEASYDRYVRRLLRLGELALYHLGPPARPHQAGPRLWPPPRRTP
jgi:hypothetical protein